VFAVPLLLWVPDRPQAAVSIAVAVRSGVGDLVRTLAQVRRHANIARFLLAKMIYIDGLNTLFTFGGIYAAGTFGMSLKEVLLFGILLNITAGVGAIGFAWVDDWIGATPTILISLVALMLLGSAILLVAGQARFYGLGLT